MIVPAIFIFIHVQLELFHLFRAHELINISIPILIALFLLLILVRSLQEAED